MGVTTGFDANLRICNYIKSLPRRQEEDVIMKLILVKSESLKEGVVAKQTKQQDFKAEVGKVGFLSAEDESDDSFSPSLRISPILLLSFMTCVIIMVYS